MNTGDTVRVVINEGSSLKRKKYNDRVAKIQEIYSKEDNSISGNPEEDLLYRLKFRDGKIPEESFKRRNLVSIEEFRNLS